MGIIGLDEVGRGAWAGPLVFAGVSFSRKHSFFRELNDSKLLSPSKRAHINEEIQATSDFYLASIDADVIDEIGLTAASEKACYEIISNMSRSLTIEKVILDGNVNYLKNTIYYHLTDVIPRADMNYYEVMAASIIAKYYRDKLMHEYEDIYPGYGFNKHVGYGTAKHRDAINNLGVLPIHRKSFKPISL